jgi:hypothetical protein
MTGIIMPELFSTWTRRFIFLLEKMTVSREYTHCDRAVQRDQSPVKIVAVCSYSLNSLGKVVTKRSPLYICKCSNHFLPECSVQSKTFRYYTNGWFCGYSTGLSQYSVQIPESL